MFFYISIKSICTFRLLRKDVFALTIHIYFRRCNMKDENFIALGNRIRQKRKAQELTQEILAEKVDVGTTHISHIETGCTKLSLKTFINIANALDVSADELLCDYITHSSRIYKNEISILLDNCTDKEIRFIYDVIAQVLDSLRKRDFH